MEHIYRYEVGEKVDYGYVINRQLDRIAEIRTNLYKLSSNDVLDNIMLNRTLDYVTALESLHTLLLPELRGNATDILIYARRMVSLKLKLEYATEEEKENIRKTMTELTNQLYEKYGLRFKDVLFITLELCDRALETMLTNLNNAGLLLRGRVVKVGVVEGRKG